MVLGKGETMAGLADGLKLPEERSTKLSREQKEVQEITGGIKYPEKIMPRITLFVHRLSTVMSFPCLRAKHVALLTLEEAWNHRFEGLTFGGDGPDGEEATQVRMHAHFDMSRPGPWGAQPRGLRRRHVGLSCFLRSNTLPLHPSKSTIRANAVRGPEL